MAKLVEFPKSNLNNIPALLRETADAIEKGEYPDATMGVLILSGPHGGWPAVFGLGADAIPPHCVWLLELAKCMLLTKHTERSV